MIQPKSVLATCIVSGASALISNDASAVQCAATVTAVSIEDTGNVYVWTSGQVAFLANAVCNVDRPVGAVRTISTRVCEKMHGQFVAALLAARPVTLWFVGNECPTLPEWTEAYALANQFYNLVLR